MWCDASKASHSKLLNVHLRILLLFLPLLCFVCPGDHPPSVQIILFNWLYHYILRLYFTYEGYTLHMKVIHYMWRFPAPFYCTSFSFKTTVVPASCLLTRAPNFSLILWRVIATTWWQDDRGRSSWRRFHLFPKHPTLWRLDRILKNKLLKIVKRQTVGIENWCVELPFKVSNGLTCSSCDGQNCKTLSASKPNNSSQSIKE